MVFGLKWQLKGVMYGTEEGKRQSITYLMTLIPLVWEAFNSPSLGNSEDVLLGIVSWQIG